MNKTLDELRMNELSMEEMEQAAGGHPFEDCFGDIALYRAGIVCEEHFFSSDEFRIGSTNISKDLAKALRSHSTKVWAGYSESGDFVAFAREWKQILANQYGISWDGRIGYLIGYCD